MATTTTTKKSTSTKKTDAKKEEKKTKNVNEFKKFWEKDQEERRISTQRPVVRIFISRERKAVETTKKSNTIDETNTKQSNSTG